jgi:hypothetical protein
VAIGQRHTSPSLRACMLAFARDEISADLA